MATHSTRIRGHLNHVHVLREPTRTPAAVAVPAYFIGLGLGRSILAVWEVSEWSVMRAQAVLDGALGTAGAALGSLVPGGAGADGSEERRRREPRASYIVSTPVDQHA